MPHVLIILYAAPVVSFGSNSPDKSDRWSSTYVSKEKSPTRSQPESSTSAPRSTSPTKRFPRPQTSTTSSNPLSGRVTTHITATTSHFNRPPSPLKKSTVVCPEEDILPSLTSNPTGHLAKVYGSVLQPKESLAAHACAICFTVFPPDATLYPEPLADGSSPPRFLCRNCFTTNGGSKGTCPGCSRPVLALKAEGPFVQAAENFWHKKCFNCNGCGRNMGNSPMLDLLGRPSCAECFDDCLKRDSTPKKNRSSITPATTTPNRNLGGLDRTSRETKSRENSPALEELEQRLGIQRSSPALEELSHRLSMIGRDGTGSPRNSLYSVNNDSPSHRSSTGVENSPLFERARRYSRPDTVGGTERSLLRGSGDSGSPTRFSPVPPQRTGSSSPAPTQDQIEEMKRRFMTPGSNVLSPPPPEPSPSPPLRRTLRRARSSGSLSHLPGDSVPSSPVSSATPDLISDGSETLSSLSGPDSPPRRNNEGDPALVAKLYATGMGTRHARSDFMEDVIIEETNSQLNTPTRTPTTTPNTKAKSYVDSARTLSRAKTASPAASPTPASTLSPPRASIEKRPQLAALTTPPADITASSTCAKCHKVLFSVRNGGQYVTVPEDEGSKVVRTYHTRCFTCSVCDKPFREGAYGQSIFVKGEKGPCHVECTPASPARRSLSPPPIAPPLPSSSSSSNSLSSHKSSSSVSSTSSNSPSNGTSLTASLGSEALLLALGVARQFPQWNEVWFPAPKEPDGTQCVLCAAEDGISRRVEKRIKTSLDVERSLIVQQELMEKVAFGAESAGEYEPSPEGSPVRDGLVPTHTGNKVQPQLTGTTTIARQFTGLGGNGDPGLLRQLPGGGLSPTRSISPTKQLSSGVRPRPKSVIGMRSSKSVDEGRGMFLLAMSLTTNFKLVLSDDSAIESVLSEIPFFCVGLVAFAVSTFFLVMKRINLLGVYLYSSAIFAFGAAILDLSQVLARGAVNVERGIGMDSVTAIINSREVGFSLSVGFRFLFFWTYIAERPRGEPPPSNLNDPKFYNAQEYAHSASWERWGVLGFLLKWSLLIGSLAIPILQIIWRIAFRKFATLYMVESTVEIIISALFILKIFLNIFLSSLTPWWRPFGPYAAPLLALAINLASGIGQLLLFLFTETTLGRFLQAVELYILILFILISSFYKVPVRPARPRGPNTASYVVSTEEKPPIQSPGTIPPSSDREEYPGNTQDIWSQRRSRQSDNSRLSSWIFARRSSRRPPSGVRWLVNPDDPELGSIPKVQLADAIGTEGNAGPEIEVINTDQFRPPPPLTIDTQTVETRDDASISSPVSREKRHSTVSFSYYGIDDGPRMSNPIPATILADESRFGAESPIYGLNGIVNARSAKHASTAAASQGSVSSIDELLRQQNELDKSIATLRLFSTSVPSELEPEPEPEPEIETDQRVRSAMLAPSRPAFASTLTARTFSTHSSSPSEFSLSSFPEPPQPANQIPPPSDRGSSVPLRIKRNTQTRHRETLSDDPSLGPPPSLPTSPTRQGGRFDSAGTQYDVTSFIGDLTAPTDLGHRPTSSFNRNAPNLSDVESEDETATVMTTRSRQSVQPILVNTTTSSDVSRAPEELVGQEQSMSPKPKTAGPPLKPLLLGNITSLPAVSSPLATSAQSRSPDSSVARRPFRGRYALPSGPRLQISNPRPPNTEGELEPAAYERPRPPPQVDSNTVNV
uniref:LIM zinc-binding domain-containing protein n=2 Tax=Moniliophthora roreri TaxID=221103 RepID=A0A0W0G2L2_MONRR